MSAEAVPMFSLDGKSALVTGAGGGIGVTVRRLSAAAVQGKAF